MGLAPSPIVCELQSLRTSLDQNFTCGGAASIVSRFSALPLIVPDRSDHIEAAELRNTCRRKGLQLGTIDALFAQLCRRRGLTMLTADRDFHQVARLIGLRIWETPTNRH